MARGGRLPEPMEIHAFARYAKSKLGVDYGLLIAAGKQEITTVALIGGGGWMENEIAQKEGYDIYLSGDCPHHGRREIVLRNYNYLDLPHEIEKAFMTRMTKTLLTINQSLVISSVDHEKLPEVI
jgi:putative NIF3 family GTP cyclohydrolase 1 type 2